MRERAYAGSRSMTWERTAERYLAVFESARAGPPAQGDRARRAGAIAPHEPPRLPEMQIDHFLSMCDDTGLFQHAVHSVPDRAHGYCVDDNARALLLACALNELRAKQPLSEVLTARFAAFVQHAWNPDTRRFRNFMGFDRAGSKTAAPRTATAGRSGRWASARAAMRARRGADGRPPCSPRHCRPSRAFARPAPGPSRCWVWTPIAPSPPDDRARPRDPAFCLPTG